MPFGSLFMLVKNCVWHHINLSFEESLIPYYLVPGEFGLLVSLLLGRVFSLAPFHWYPFGWGLSKPYYGEECHYEENCGSSLCLGLYCFYNPDHSGSLFRNECTIWCPAFGKGGIVLPHGFGDRI